MVAPSATHAPTHTHTNLEVGAVEVVPRAGVLILDHKVQIVTGLVASQAQFHSLDTSGSTNSWPVGQA